MGAAESRPEAGESSIAQGSPAQYAGLYVFFSRSEPFFDFCIGINGQPLANLGVEYPPGNPVGAHGARANWTTVEANEGREIVLNVWSSKQQAYRDVLEGSPADSAGLVPFGDYIIGWTGGPLESESDFFQLIEHHAGRNLAVYVYNRDYDHTREVIIMPNRDWGGEGLLGCGVGYDRIPKPQRTWEQDDDLQPPSQDTAVPSVSEEYDQTAQRSYAPSCTHEHADYNEKENASGVTVSIHAEEDE